MFFTSKHMTKEFFNRLKLTANVIFKYKSNKISLFNHYTKNYNNKY